MSKYSCGIDFGTSNSSASISTPSVSLINLEEDSPIIPSAIFFGEEGKKISFGNHATKHYMAGESGRYMRSIKRILGTPLMSSTTNIFGKQTSFKQILGYFLKNIKDQIDNAANSDVTNVVMGRPVHFKDNDHKADTKAQEELSLIAKMVGFRHVEFQFEPIAAAFSHEQSIKDEQLACVIDIGGGTSDFTIIKLGQKLINKPSRKDDILANTGVRIGGNDFDKNLSLSSFMPEFGKGSLWGGATKVNPILEVPTSQYFDLSEWSSINNLYNHKTISIIKNVLSQSLEPQKYSRLLSIIEQEKGHALLGIVEDSKIELTNKNMITSKLNSVIKDLSIQINKDIFEQAIGNNIQKIITSINECIKLAQTTADDIKIIVLTGGSTEIPYIKQSIKSIFPNAEISQKNKLSSVGLGLGYDSARIFGC